MDKEYRYLPMQKQAGLWGLVGASAAGTYAYQNSDTAREVMDDAYRFFARPGEDDSKTLGAFVNKKIEDAEEAIREGVAGSPETRASSDRNVASWLNTLNAFSGMTGGIDYVPAKWYKLFAKDLDPVKDKAAYNQAMKNAHLSINQSPRISKTDVHFS